MFSNNIKLNAKHVVKPYQTIIQTQCKTLGKLIYILKQKTKTIHTLCGIRRARLRFRRGGVICGIDKPAKDKELLSNEKNNCKKI